MPTSTIYNMAKKAGISKKDIEKYWDKAKELTMDAFGYRSEDDFSKENNRGWKYAVGIIKKMTGQIKDSYLKKYIKSSKKAIDFIENIVVSGSFDIGSVKPPKDSYDKNSNNNLGDEIDKVIDKKEEESIIVPGDFDTQTVRPSKLPYSISDLEIDLAKDIDKVSDAREEESPYTESRKNQNYDQSKLGYGSAQTLGNKFKMNPDTIYEWAKKNDIDLLLSGSILANQSVKDFLDSVFDGTTEYIKGELSYGFREEEHNESRNNKTCKCPDCGCNYLANSGYCVKCKKKVKKKS